jgi:hypothetical protein
MKKILFFGLAVMWLLVSCDSVRSGYEEDTWWYVEEFTVHASDWKLVNGVNALDSYYERTFSFYELTREIFKRGQVLCYMYKDNDTQTLLPSSIHYGEVDGGKESLWTETYNCDFSVRSITFTVKYSDFKTEIRPPTTKFKVVLIN